jgi:glycopeptide antibiotics resistance protein
MFKKIFSILFYIASIIFVGFYFLAEITPHLSLSEFGRLFLLCCSCLFLYFGGLLLSKYLNNNNPMKINLWIFFVLYLILLITLTLFDPMWGRNGHSFINWSSEEFSFYINNSVNLIPFKTILSYIGAFDSLYSSRTILLNLLGNLIALMPMAFFLPLLFKRQDKFKNFVITSILIVIGIELTQFLTASGSCDIDDVILNTLGAIIMYFILQINSIKKIIGNIFLLQKNKLSKKDITKVISILFIWFILIVGLVKFRNKLYDRNLEDYMNKNNPIIEIIDKSEDCVTILDKFYEDKLFNYYFTCIKSNNVYAKINNNEIYLVKDLLNNNPTEYDIRPRNMLDNLKYYNVDYVKENKYEYISLSVDVPNKEENVIVYPSQVASVENENVLEVLFDYNGSNMNLENEYTINLHLLPKQAGETNISIEFKSGDTNELIDIFNYSVKVDKELNVSFKEIE